MNYKIITALLAVLIIGAGGYWLGNQKQNSSATTPTSVQSSTPPMATPTPDPTKDWKTYSNTKYGYSLKYPATVTLYEDNTYYHYLEFKRTNTPPR